MKAGDRFFNTGDLSLLILTHGYFSLDAPEDSSFEKQTLDTFGSQFN